MFDCHFVLTDSLRNDGAVTIFDELVQLIYRVN